MVAEVVKEEPETRQSQSFTPDQLKSVWEAYKELAKQEGKTTELTILNQEFDLHDKFLIELKLQNRIQEDIMERFRMDLVNYLRRELNNHDIKLKTTIVEEETSRKLYTSQDKLNYLIEQNPKILELQKRLGLDTDY